MYNRLHYWLVGLGLRQARDLAFGAHGNVGIPSAGPIDIHETVGRSVPGPAGAWLDQGWYTGPDGHRLSNGAVTALLNKHAGTGSAWLTRLHDSFWVSYQPGRGAGSSSSSWAAAPCWPPWRWPSLPSR
jgi:hypothetical protein